MGKTEKVSEKRLFAGFAAVEIFCMVVGIKSGKAGEVLLTEGILAGMFLTVWTGNYFVENFQDIRLAVWKSEKSVEGYWLF